MWGLEALFTFPALALFQVDCFIGPDWPTIQSHCFLSSSRTQLLLLDSIFDCLNVSSIGQGLLKDSSPDSPIILRQTFEKRRRVLRVLPFSRGSDV